MKTPRQLIALSIIVIIVISAAVAVYLTRTSAPRPISLAPTTFVAVQGTQIAFTVFGLESNGVATVYLGDGHEANTTSTITHAYQTPGRYLVAAQEFVNRQPVASTFNALQTIQITPQVSGSLAPLISLPAVLFDTTRNPSAPVVRVGDSVYLYGGFLEAPSGTNMTIMEYVWDFGNGVTKTVAANSTSFKPADNPSAATYNQPGLYPVTLTLVTENSTSMTTYKTSVEQTVAVGSTSQPYAVFRYGGVVPNPTVVNVAENYPGGPRTLDPNTSFEITGGEVMANIFSSLLFFNGSSTTDFVPIAATQIPSVSNGEISPDYTTYRFQIRQGLEFSNGDPLTAYDVWYSVVRGMLFASRGVNWILAQYLVPNWDGFSPVMSTASDTADFNAIMNAATYSNATGTVTFKLIRPINPQLFFSVLAFPYPSILDSSWLRRVGAGITFTPAGFYSYQNHYRPYNLEVQNNPVSSGPYMIQNYVPGQSITLVPNPGFGGVPGIPKANNTVVIQWVRDAETGYNLFRSGQADIVIALPTNYLPLINREVANGQAALYQFPALFARFFQLTLGINETAMKADYGSQYHIPSDYFANLNVRKAFAYAFDYTTYINEILGNAKYGVDFGRNYAGLIIKGLPYYVPESELHNVPTYNLTYAKQLLKESGEYDTSVNIPVVIRAGITLDFEAAALWAAAINSIDPNIVLTPIYVPLQLWGGDRKSIPIWAGDWGADYPYPSDFVDPFYKDPLAVDYLNSTGHPDQAAMYAQMNSLIDEADLTTNPTLAAQDYKQVEQIAVNLYLYVYTVQVNSFWVVKPYMNGYQGQISYQMNPLIGGVNNGLYFWWVKTCGSNEACSGRSIGP